MELKELEAAKKRIENYIVKTPLIPLKRLEEKLGFTPWLKLENLQNIGAFKIRGAMNAALQLSPEEISKGFITASSGNHGRAVSYAAKALNTKALILLPNTVSHLKHQAIKDLGAETMLVEPQQRIEIAQQISKERDLHFIHPYNDMDVILGQASLGFEILEQLSSVKKIFVPMGGGGLISGILLAIKAIKPSVEVIGLEPAALPKFSHNLNKNIIEAVEESPSIADALLSNKPGALALEIVRERLDRLISVEEAAIKEAFKLLLEEGKILAEPSSVIGLASVLQEQMKGQDFENSVFLISGGNISLDSISKIMY